MRSELIFAADHPAFAGHFPGRPIVPGVLLLDAALSAVRGQMPDAPAQCRISAAKFLSPVQPGEPLTLSWTAGENGQARFEITCGERRVATGVFAFGGIA